MVSAMHNPQTLADYFSIIYRRRLIVILTIVAAAFSAYILSAGLKPVYRAEAEFYVAETKSSGGLLSRGGALASLSSITGPVVQKESMKSYKGMLESLVVAELVQQIVPGTDMETITSNRDIAATSTNLIKVRFRHSDPVQAAAIANAFPAALNRFLQSNERSKIEKQVESMDRLLADLTVELESRRSVLEHYVAQVQDPTLTADVKLREETLRREIEVIEDNFTTLATNFQESRVKLQSLEDTVVVVSPAQVDKNPIFPLPIVNVLVAVILALVFGIYIALMYDYLLRLHQSKRAA